MGTGTGGEEDTQEKYGDYGEIDDFEFYWFGAVETINKAIDGIQHSREISSSCSERKPVGGNKYQSLMQSGNTRVVGSETTLVELEADYEGASSQRGIARVSTALNCLERTR